MAVTGSFQSGGRLCIALHHTFFILVGMGIWAGCDICAYFSVVAQKKRIHHSSAVPHQSTSFFHLLHSFFSLYNWQCSNILNLPFSWPLLPSTFFRQQSPFLAISELGTYRPSGYLAHTC